MIHRLVVENIALIDRLDVEFAPGLNVLSGETGAGKSIIVNSMNLILGERADRDMIRTGAGSARVEAVLYVDVESMGHAFEEYGLAAEEELIISRELSASGKNVCRLNGAMVNLSTLKGFMDNVVDLVGQHEHQSLLLAANHIKLIDGYGGEGIAALKGRIAGQYGGLRALEAEMEKTGGDEASRQDAVNLLEYKIQELSEAGVREGELEELVGERDILINAETISGALRRTYDVLEEGEGCEMSALSAIMGCVRDMDSLVGFSEEYASLAERLRENYYVLEETARDIGAAAEEVTFDARRQEEVEERISYINSLKRKYGAEDELELLGMLSGAQGELEALLHSEERAKELAADISSAKSSLYALYGKLSAERKKAAVKLAAALKKELNDLGMTGAGFEARFSPMPELEDTVFTRSGPEHVEFYIATNKGEGLKPLSKTASGGEISRIMLAFKNVIAKTDSISTMIFDEIDTGISGRMARTVAEKMAGVAKTRQLICVTHLAQIAAIADRNFLISKEEGEAAVNTRITQLDGEEVTAEIARLSGGTNTASALGHARELVQDARKVKEALH